LSLRAMIMCASASAVAPPPISFFMFSIDASGLMSRPPVSKQTPLPTSVTCGCFGSPHSMSISRGSLANGIGNILAGLVGSVGLSPSTANVGLQAASAVSSRVIGYAIGGILIALAFFPSLTGSLILMPRPVMGAALLFSACFVLISGLQTVTSRMVDARRTLVIGLSIAASIAAEIVPGWAANIPALLQPIVSSSIVLGTIAALLLNGLFRIGQRQRVTLTLDPAATDAVEQVDEFFATAGREWGARPDVMVRVSFGINQAIETIRENCEPEGPVAVEAHFDEFNLDVRISYRGAPLELRIGRQTYMLGADIDEAQVPQIVVPAGAWQAARSLGDYTLVGCTVSPGFEFEHFELAPDGFEP